MEIEYIRQRLPVDPPEGLIKWAKETQSRELGSDYMVWSSERLPVLPTIGEIMEYNSMAPQRYEWTAVCHCSACQEQLITSRLKGVDGIRLFQGEDGCIYEYPPNSGMEQIGEGGLYDLFDGETVTCPSCWNDVELIHSRKVKGGRTKRILAVAVQVVEGYLAIVYWLVYRTIDEYALSEYGAKPADAYVLDERGRLVHFSRILRGGAYAADRYRTEWVYRSDNSDTLLKPYNDWGSINNRKVGGDLFPVIPDLTGTTGEKTGIDVYLRNGGWYPVKYLKFWRRFPAVENLCKSPHPAVIPGIVAEAERFSYDLAAEAVKWLDLSERKPHRMLLLSKEEYRALVQKGRQLTLLDLQLLRSYRDAGGQKNACELLAAAEQMRKSGTIAMLQLMRDYGDCDIDRLLRYMAKQNMPPHELGYLLDTRRMAKGLAGDRDLLPEELWPRNLAAAHERYMQMEQERRAARQKKENAAIDEKFRLVVDKFGCLQWTDGDLCVVLPLCSEDLHREGQVLRHCVGSYSSRHIAGQDTIFFVRRYRRPERPYYTLDIDMTGKPREVQLHGYGNERHGIHKEHTHKIPQRVRQFCDRWKREVLLPWYAAEQLKKNQEVKTA